MDSHWFTYHAYKTILCMHVKHSVSAKFWKVLQLCKHFLTFNPFLSEYSPAVIVNEAIGVWSTNSSLVYTANNTEDTTWPCEWFKYSTAY